METWVEGKGGAESSLFFVRIQIRGTQVTFQVNCFFFKGEKVVASDLGKRVK